MMLLLKCPECNAKLELSQKRCVCPLCRAEWPVNDGIPRFFQAPTYYWGEIDRNDARELLEAARKGSWAEAVRARFPEGDNMSFGVLDLQRASWAPMLGLNERSVALDIGSGYGAITHSLARSVGEVYSIEAISERIEFTQERLRQEGICNVRLIQASATTLPLLDNNFDLVVVNGVLEWVGEWDLQADPRSAQLKFLDSVCRLLKDQGVLVIGIENRFGYGLFLGQTDHSGIAYTSLIPRRIASFMLRHSSTDHYRTELNRKREYRTYTYSERGYRRLLADAGFKEVSCYWAEPGYNQPYHLIPLSRPQWVQELFLDLLDHPGPAPQRSWRRRLKRAIAPYGLLRQTVPDFLFLASKCPGRQTDLQSWVEERLRESRARLEGAALDPQPIAWALYAKPFKSKSVVRLGDPRNERDLAYLKVTIGAQGSTASFDVEVANREKIREGLEALPSQAIAVPQAYGALRVGNTSYSMESAAKGTQLCRIIRRLGYFTDSERVQNDFGRLFEGLIDFTKALQAVSGAHATSAGWRVIPDELGNDPAVHAAIEEMRYFSESSGSSCATWIQHGDLSAENIFLDQETGRIEVVDWADLASGFPPLYDFFQLFFSTGYLAPADETVRFSGELERWIASFNGIFFTDTQFGRTVREFILRACERLKILPELIPSLLVEFLLIRTHYYQARSIEQRRIYLRLLQFCFERNCSVFGNFQFRRPSKV
jgi:ubiquinone/menaquinone biosynthesis C-methylase UbiE